MGLATPTLQNRVGFNDRVCQWVALAAEQRLDCAALSALLTSESRWLSSGWTDM